MRGMSSAKILIALVTLSMGRAVLSNSVQNYAEQMETAVVSLGRLLDYLHEPRDVNGDLLFGVLLAGAQLKILKEHITLKTVMSDLISFETVSRLENKTWEIYYDHYNKIQNWTNRRDYNSVMETIVKPELWTLDIPITFGKLREPSIQALQFKEPRVLNVSEKIHLLMSGTPRSGESDKCLRELVIPKKCGMDDDCKYIETNEDEVTGYSLTHRLLFYQVARRLGCDKYENFKDIQEREVKLCSDILAEMYHLLSLGMPPEFRDLFLEQIVLCGIEGFAEFLNPHVIDWAVLLQMPEGCFTQKNTKESVSEAKSSRRVKRDDGEMGGGCTMHITGIAAAFLAVNIRGIVEYWGSE